MSTLLLVFDNETIRILYGIRITEPPKLISDAEPEIMARHWTFPNQIWQMSGRFQFWLDILSEQKLFLLSIVFWTNFLNV